MSRIAIVKKENCKGGIDCPYLCMSSCPVNRTGKECINKINRNFPESKVSIDEKLCIGCGICVKRCPFETISIINLPEEIKSAPVHRYGNNGFALYSLPIPIFGKVVGIIGRNGIGKSTAVKILSGVLAPNFGDYNKKPTESAVENWNSLIEFYKGTEAQVFFERVKAGKIRTSYKIQPVEMIPKFYNGTVRALLEKADEKKNLKKIAEKLDLAEIMDRNVKDISGGELQRVAIAASSLKDANLYIFDEPSSYLDAKQRVKVSKFIRELADEKTAVIVIEHDLIILDFMTELIHIMYGKEDCYGVCSLPKTTRIGINIYLSGFLKEENMRFRDSEIKFASKPPIDIKRQVELVSWNGIKKNLGEFSLSAPHGTLYRHQTIGVLGENGIGKTTFVKILAGILESEGSVSSNVRVSYKPQYLTSDSNELVMTILSEAVQRHTADLIEPLALKQFLTKRLREISGGELQRVAIAECLSRDAELYLLDEPSAYLDVEQRLVVSKTIKDFAERKGSTVLVVDHDLMFIDYLSERLIVFDGKPALSGNVSEVKSMSDGMNAFLMDLGITLRRDLESNRPRINKEDSRKDREQKAEGKLYYD
ncbi:MAG: ribosome biogenesis/translation initiation ATPase RLI [Candidatus Woesearchaeota archaeon]|nr:ribosome biogenesis/translation initiation ATPase RLI [Candidatus Woesearchaeota archaeon]